MFKCKTKPQKCPKSKVRFIKSTHTPAIIHCHCRSCAPSSHTKFLALSHTLSLSMLETIYSNFHQPSEIFSFYLIQYLLDNCQCYTNSHANKIVNASVEGVAVYSCYCCCYCVCVCVFFIAHILVFTAMVGKVNTYNIRKRNIEQGLSYTTTARRFSNLLTVTIDIMSEKCSHQFSMPNPSAVVVNRKTIEKDYCSPRCVSVLLFILLRFRSSKTIIVKRMYVLTTSILHVAKKKTG